MESLNMEESPAYGAANLDPAIFDFRGIWLCSEQHHRLSANCGDLECRLQGPCKRALIGIIVIARKHGYDRVRIDLCNVQKAIEDRGSSPSIARLHNSMAEAVAKVWKVVILVCLRQGE